MAVNNKNEIVVTDFHNHSVKVWLVCANSMSENLGPLPESVFNKPELISSEISKSEFSVPEQLS